MWISVSQPKRGEIFAEQRRGAGAVDVVIAEDGDPLAPRDGAGETLGGGAHIGERQRVWHEVAQRRLQVALDRVEFDAAPGQEARDQLADPRALRHRLRPRLAGRVEPMAPAPAAQRRLDVEKQPAHRRIGARARPQFRFIRLSPRRAP